MHALLSTLGSGCGVTSCFKILLCLLHNDGVYPGIVSLKLKQVTTTRKSKLKTFLQKNVVRVFYYRERNETRPSFLSFKNVIQPTR